MCGPGHAAGTKRMSKAKDNKLFIKYTLRRMKKAFRIVLLLRIEVFDFRTRSAQSEYARATETERAKSEPRGVRMIDARYTI